MKQAAGIFLLSLLVVILSASFVIAGTMYGPHIKKGIAARQKRIDKEIEPGWRCLARTEARKSQHHLSCIRVEELRLKVDGRLTKMERARLYRMPDLDSKKIYCKRYNSACRLY
jgi:hypothetical protein